MNKTITRLPQLSEERSECILVLDDDAKFLESVRKKLTRGGFSKIYFALDILSAEKLLVACQPDLALIDIHLRDNDTCGLDFIRLIREKSHTTMPVVLSGDRTQKQFFKTARAGAVDFFVKGPQVNIVQESCRLLDGKRGAIQSRTRPEIVSDLGYLRSFGLTSKEIAVLTDFSSDFPKLSVLADRIPQAKTQLRKVFSRIYEKLGIRDLNQLVSILTICEFFDRDN